MTKKRGGKLPAMNPLLQIPEPTHQLKAPGKFCSEEAYLALFRSVFPKVV